LLKSGHGAPLTAAPAPATLEIRRKVPREVAAIQREEEEEEAVRLLRCRPRHSSDNAATKAAVTGAQVVATAGAGAPAFLATATAATAFAIVVVMV